VPPEVTLRTWGDVLGHPTRRPVVLASLVWAVLALAYLGARAAGAPDRVLASYWTNGEWSGAAALTRTEGAIRTDREGLKRLLGDSQAYSAVWTGVVFAPRAGEYLFTVTSDDGSWVLLDGVTVIDNGGHHGAETRTARLHLTRGPHALTVRYFDAGGLGVINFSWRATGLVARAFPAGVLYPSPGGSERASADWALAIVRNVLHVLLIVVGGIALVAVALVAVAMGPGRGRRAETVLASLLFAAVLGTYGAHLLARRSTAVTACDSYAYLQGATVMATRGPLHTELHDPLVPRIVEAFRARPSDRDLAFLLSPHGHYVHDFGAGVIYNDFPPGLMWLLLPFVAAGVTSWTLLILPVLTLAVALAFFVIASHHVDAWFAASAAAFLVCNPVVFENTVLLMSDVPSMALTAASAYLLFANLVTPRAALPAVAGACFGAALTVRYSNAAAIVPVLVLFAVEWARRRNLKALIRNVALFGVGATVVGVLPLALYTQTQFGTLLRLTYDPYTASKMSLGHFLPNLFFYARGMVRAFSVPVLAVVAVGIVACVAGKRHRLLAVAGLLTLAAFLLPYAFESLHEHRYLMPVYPWLGLFYGFGALAIGSLFRRVEIVRRLALAVLVVAPLLAGWHRLPGGTVLRDRTSRLLGERVGQEAVVFCDDVSGPVRLYANLTGYRFVWTRFEVLAETCEILVRLGRPVYFFLDSDPAKEHFKLLREKGALRADRIAFVGDVDGYPLWRYGGAP
jgi:hypothetical protein